LDKKIKVLVLSDHPLSPSGVGTQTKYMIESLIKTGKFSFYCLAGAMKHLDYNITKVEGFGDDWVIMPVDGYGTPEHVRTLMRNEKPDIVWFMTDPRFWGWLWEMEDEIRPVAPMVYYHVWDNYPYPTYNKAAYTSNDVIACISKVTHDIVQNVSPEVESYYIPHSVDTNIFDKIDESTVQQFRESHFSNNDGKFLIFWNNRNARRKQSGSLIYWFKKFLDKVGHDKAQLLMHTDVKDPHGQDLEAIVHSLGLINGEVMFSQQKVSAFHMAILYNMADCTINVSDAEGFGLSTFESLACETPIIVNMTGGLQEQVTDGKNWFGVGIQPASKAIIGSQEIPWIYEDRVSEEDVVNALLKLYNMSKEDRQALGKAGREHVIKNYNFDQYTKRWEELLLDVHERHGSWDTRKGYNSWELIEIGAAA
tara:strand:+ start:439 stop:1707 length:1269 start_codon:yes stop_codon:yes gene_type:complete